MSRKWVGILGSLFLFSILMLGCAGTSKEMQTRCPKCGSYFDSRQGEQMMRYIQGL